MLNTLLANNFSAIIIVVGMWIFISTNRSFEKRITNLFLYFVFTVLVLIIADAGDYYFRSFDHYVFMRNITSSLGYILRPMTLVFVIKIVDRRRKSNIIIWIPIIIEAILAFTSSFTHIMFWFDEYNKFQRGVLSYLPHMLSAIYMLTLVILTIFKFKTLDTGESFTIFFIAILCVSATILETAFGFKFLLTDAMAISGIFYYMYFYAQTYKRDSLTGLLNRNCFYIDSEKVESVMTAIITIDINYLKEINDTDGHNAGDIAICTVADSLLRSSSKGYYVYRTGGDEFIVLGIKKTADDVQEYITTMNAYLKDSPYTVAAGYAIYAPTDDFEEKCKESDAMMYENKLKIKKEMSGLS